MERTIRVDTGRVRTKVRNHGFNAPAEVVDIWFMRAEVDPLLFGTIRSGGEIGHHPRPE